MPACAWTPAASTPRPPGPRSSLHLPPRPVHGRDAALLLAGIAAANDLAYVAEVLDHWRERPGRLPRYPLQAGASRLTGTADLVSPGRRGSPHPAA